MTKWMLAAIALLLAFAPVTANAQGAASAAPAAPAAAPAAAPTAAR